MSAVDDVRGRYVDWREDAAAAEDAYRQWCACPPDESPWRFSAYMAALQQEERSANSYGLVVSTMDRSLRGAQRASNPVGSA